MRRAKIVCTLGPATDSPEHVQALVDAGMNVARINRSHGRAEDQEDVIARVRDAAETSGRPVAILVDLQGPKIRLGTFVNDQKVMLNKGDEFTITTDDILGTVKRVSTTFKGLPGDCRPGDRLLIDDGNVAVRVTAVTDTDVITKVEVPGYVSNHKGLNLPGVAVSVPALSEKDRDDLRWAIKIGADLIALSFVRSADDIKDVHDIMDEAGVRIPVIAKIEKPQAVEALEEIVEAFDGIMVARGDMAVEMPFEQVPLITKRCIELSRNYGKPVIVATEVLGSMVHSPVPTRAEASDCANAVLDGADATMTSNETAVGDYPVVTVDTMSRISSYATEHGYDRIPGIRDEHYTVSSAVAHSAVELASKLDVDAIVAFTRTGATVHRISAERPQAPIFGLTTDVHTKSFLNLSWGTQGIQLGRDYHGLTRAELMQLADEAVKGTGRLEDGDTIVVVSCSPAATEAGSTDSVYVHVIGHED